jgi:hypothetical protein
MELVISAALAGTNPRKAPLNACHVPRPQSQHTIFLRLSPIAGVVRAPRDQAEVHALPAHPENRNQATGHTHAMIVLQDSTVTKPVQQPVIVVR